MVSDSLSDFLSRTLNGLTDHVPWKFGAFQRYGVNGIQILVYDDFRSFVVAEVNPVSLIIKAHGDPRLVIMDYLLPLLEEWLALMEAWEGRRPLVWC